MSQGTGLANYRQLAPKQKLNTLAGLVRSRKEYFQQVLPRHVDPDRFARVVVASLSRTPALLQCSPESVMLSVAQAAQLGLEPTGTLGSAYLVPYKGHCQLIIGYRGLIDLARRSGQIESLEAHVVREGDRFECSFGLEPQLRHEPDWDSEGELRFVYAIARLKGGAVQYEVMSRAQIEKVRKGSPSGNRGPWVDHFEEMARKTVVRRLAKYLPLNVELASALDHEERVDSGATLEVDIEAINEAEEGGEIIELGAEPAKLPEAKSTERVKARVKRQQVKAPAEEPTPFDDDEDPGFDPDEIPL